MSLLDIVPTVLDWLHIEYPEYTMEGHKVILTGQSLMSEVNDKEYLIEKYPVANLTFPNMVSVSDPSMF